MGVVRNVARGPVVVARGTWAGTRGAGRGLWRGGRWVFRGAAGSSPEAVRKRQQLWLGFTGAVAFVMYWIAFGTAGLTYDVGRFGDGVRPFIAAAAGLPFAFAATRYLTGAWLVSLGSGVGMFWLLPVLPTSPWPWTVPHGMVMLALLGVVCARERGARAVGAWLITAAVWALAVPSEQSAGWAFATTVVAVLGLLAGRLTRTRRALVAQEQVSSQERAARMVLEERARIARDLHDIVAHHMSLVVVQAETAPYRVPGLTDEARAELESISSSARSALAETRTMLALLRQEGDRAEHAPQPGLERLDELVDGARRAGVPIEVQTRGGLDDLRPGVSLAGYRIVQEALANVARHAPGAPVTLEVSRDAGALDLAVVNGSPPGGVQPAADGQDAGPGHGITGMRERVAAEGGSMTIGPTQAGGFAVRVTLPLEVRA